MVNKEINSSQIPAFQSVAGYSQGTRYGRSMLRRNIRLRKEYLYRKSLELQQNETRERKKQIKATIEAGKIENSRRPFDPHLSSKMKEACKPGNAQDDEYAYAGVKDPHILITTSRDPSSRLLQFVKELKLIIPNSKRVNRGAYVVADLVKLCQTNDVTDLMVIHEHRGAPDGLVVSHMPLGPTVYFSLEDVVLRHDLPNKPPPMSQVNPHLIFEQMSSRLDRSCPSQMGALHIITCSRKYMQDIFSTWRNFHVHFTVLVQELALPPSYVSYSRPRIPWRSASWRSLITAIKCMSDIMYGRTKGPHALNAVSGRKAFLPSTPGASLSGDIEISSGAADEMDHTENKSGTSESNLSPAVAGKETGVAKKRVKWSLDGIVLTEVGPRFVLRPYRIELGTLDMKDLEVEWSLKPFFKTPNRHALS